jgi:transposase InsO family protein
VRAAGTQESEPPESSLLRARSQGGSPAAPATHSLSSIDLCLANVSQATVAKYMIRRRTPPSQTWRTFLTNHVEQLAAADFFVVPTATCRLLFVLLILAHERRRVVHIAVTDHPTAAWTAQQLREAFPWDEAPKYLVHDRDTAFRAWATTAPAIGIDEVVTAVRSPWQNAYAERLIGSIRRECLDHLIIGNARGLRRVLNAYVQHYLKSRTHLSLDKDAPVSRPIAVAGRRRDRGDSAARWPTPPLRTPRGVRQVLTRFQRLSSGQRHRNDRVSSSALSCSDRSVTTCRTVQSDSPPFGGGPTTPDQSCRTMVNPSFARACVLKVRPSLGADGELLVDQPHRGPV